MHGTTGWAWAPTIAASCLLMRFCMFPLYVESKKQMIGYIGQMGDVQKNILNFQADGSDQQQMMDKQQKAMKSMTDLQRSMPRVFASPLVSGLVFSSYYFCLRAMANHPLPSMQAESFLWVPSLTAADPYGLFPLLTATTMFLTLRYNMETGEWYLFVTLVLLVVLVLLFSSSFFEFSLPSSSFGLPLLSSSIRFFCFFSRRFFLAAFNSIRGHWDRELSSCEAFIGLFSLAGRSVLFIALLLISYNSLSLFFIIRLIPSFPIHLKIWNIFYIFHTSLSAALCSLSTLAPLNEQLTFALPLQMA